MLPILRLAETCAMLGKARQAMQLTWHVSVTDTEMNTMRNTLDASTASMRHPTLFSCFRFLDGQQISLGPLAYQIQNNAVYTGHAGVHSIQTILQPYIWVRMVHPK